MYSILIWLVALVGLAFGSFANVVVHRLKTGLSLRTRSICSQCGKRILARDLIPVVSWIHLGGRCRHCHEPISIQYPIVELLTAMVFVFAYLRHSFLLDDANAASFVFEAGVAWALIVIATFDLRWQLIPMKLVWVTIEAVVVWRLVLLSAPWFPLALGAAFGGAWIALLFLLSRGKWVGSGDIWLAILLGTSLSWPLAIFGLYLAYMVAGLIAAVLLISGRKRFGQRIAFAPFIAIGLFGTWWFGEPVLTWFQSLYLY